ncbi:hypothetical protein [Nocardioides mesophilus]|uniref:Uncharacterized protein n=1 Tax=Nocardioides mesophilus TaxID=433659 RepID=A0A7G9R7X4_9ACTN|nr:hypothetical protein [Nocardioides mesophilus]QNN51699.1 hypothetical protein H9L09_14150 [Nocardioides mesophilus]
MSTTDFSGSETTASPYGTTSDSKTDQAKQAAGTAKDESRHVAGVAQDEAKNVASEAKSQVHGLIDQATSQVEEQSRSQKDKLASTTRTFGDDLGSMAANGEGLAADLARQVAERAKSLSSHLENREPGELLDDVRDFARRKPGTFLLGALAAGVVAGRLTRGAKEAREGQSSSTTGTAYGTGTTYGQTYAADVTSPGDPYTTGYAAGTSGAVDDPTLTGTGTAAGDPLAGTGTPGADPVYPAGSDVTTSADPSNTWTDTSEGGRL